MAAPKRSSRVSRKRRRRKPARWPIVVVGAAVLFLAGFGIGRLWRPRQAKVAAAGVPRDASGVTDEGKVGDSTTGADRRGASPPRPAAVPVTTELEESAEQQGWQEGRPDGPFVAIVVDDLGRSVETIRRLLSWNVALSYSVLPYETHTAEVTRALRQAQVEILCHLPMEGSAEADPGPGALRQTMTGAELARLTEAALAQVVGAQGVNNHMGSVLSADAMAMRSVLRVVEQHGLFFLDSRTASESRAYDVAMELGVAAGKRQVFLDRDPSAPAIAEQFQELLALARRQGAAIAITHPHRATLDRLEIEVQRALGLGYRFVPVSYLLDRSS